MQLTPIIIIIFHVVLTEYNNNDNKSQKGLRFPTEMKKKHFNDPRSRLATKHFYPTSDHIQNKMFINL